MKWQRWNHRKVGCGGYIQLKVGTTTPEPLKDLIIHGTKIYWNFIIIFMGYDFTAPSGDQPPDVTVKS